MVDYLDSKEEKSKDSSVGKTIATKIPLNIHEELVYLVESGAYLSISDFLRDAIREKLKVYKIMNIRNIDYNEAKREIISYFEKYRDCYLDEIAMDLNLDFKVVSNIIDDLLRDKKIKLNDLGFSNEIEFNDNLLKLYGKHLIVISQSVDKEFLKINKDGSFDINIKKKGFILENGVAIISNHYSLII